MVNIIIEPHVGSGAWDRLCSPFATCDTAGISSLPHPEGENCITSLCTKWTFLAQRHFFSSVYGSFLLFAVAGHAGGPREHWVQVWALAEVRGTCSWGSKSRKLVHNHGIAFLPAKANQDDANPKTKSISATRKFLFFSPKKLAFHHT